jgi:hypothetical protein
MGDQTNGQSEETKATGGWPVAGQADQGYSGPWGHDAAGYLDEILGVLGEAQGGLGGDGPTPPGASADVTEPPL